MTELSVLTKLSACKLEPEQALRQVFQVKVCFVLFSIIAFILGGIDITIALNEYDKKVDFFLFWIIEMTTYILPI